MAQMSVSQVEGVTVVKLSGELTHDGTPTIENAFVMTMGSLNRAVVDLSGVTLISTLGITTIVAADRQMRRKGGMLVVCGMSGTVEEVIIQRCKLDAILAVAKDIPAAVKLAKAS